MRSVIQLKSLGDLRTTISTHARSTPRQKGSSYLEIYLLDIEGQRLEAELAMLAKRQRRIEGRLSEIVGAKEKVLNGAIQEESGLSVPPASATRGNKSSGGNGSEPGKWTTMTIEY